MNNQFNIGDIVEWEHSNRVEPFVGFIINLNKKENEVTIHWFNNASLSTYGITLLNHFKKVS